MRFATITKDRSEEVRATLDRAFIVPLSLLLVVLDTQVALFMAAQMHFPHQWAFAADSVAWARCYRSLPV
jgi:hypothetical protein